MRRQLRAWLIERDANEAEVSEILVAVSEAVNNAIQHAQRRQRERVDVEAFVVDDRVTVCVRDYGAWRSGSTRDEGGRGLAIMRDLMDAVEIDRMADGTSIKLQRHLTFPS